MVLNSGLTAIYKHCNGFLTISVYNCDLFEPMNFLLVYYDSMFGHTTLHGRLIGSSPIWRTVKVRELGT